MLRPLASACGLILVGVLAAGCGDGYQAAVRQHTEQLLGNGNPKILRIETVHDLGGNEQIVATVQGRFKLPSPNMPCGRCWYGGPPPRYAWISFSQPAGMDGEEVTTALRIAAIDNAHSERPVFNIFPYNPTTAIQCAIPRGIVSGTIAGRCSTHFDGPFAHPTSITFHEAWAFSRAPWGTRVTKGGGWIVALNRAGHVESVRRFGDLPPQYWN